MHKNQNPFAKEDLFVEIVKLDDNVNKSMRKSLQNYIFKNHIPSSTLMTQFQKVLTFFTTHTLTAVVTATICLGTIGTFAAQTVAPEQYKPSTVINNLFKNNKIQQSNPNTPLVSDAQNDVVSYNPCNISIKYPKQIASEKILAVKPQDYNQPGDKTIPDYYGVTVMSQKSFNYDATSQIQGNIDFSCSKEFISPLDNNLNSTMTSQELADLTGWFITGEQKLEEISTENQTTAGPFRTVYFRFKDYYYRIAFTTKKIPTNILNSQPEDIKTFWNNAISKPGIFGDQVQIQFNNVVNNTPNAEILKFDNVATSGFLFEYDKKLELKNKEKFEFSDPGKNNTFYVVNDKALQDQITKLGLNNGDTIIFSGQVTNLNGKINITKQEEFTITKIDNVVRSISEIEKSNLDSNPKPIVFDDYEPVFFSKIEDLSPSKPNNPIYYFKTKNKTLITIPKSYFDRKYFPINDTTPCSENCTFMYAVKGTVYYSGGPGGDSYSPSQTPIGDSLDFGFNGGGGPRIFTDDAPISKNSNTIFGGGIPVRTDTSPTFSSDGKTKLYYGGSNATPQGESTVRTDGPNTEEKNGLKTVGNLFVPQSQNIRETESFDEYSPISCDIVALKYYANNSNGVLSVTNSNSYTSNSIGNFNSTTPRLNQLKDYIKTGKGDISKPINAFHSSCGGFASELMKELGYTDQSGRQSRAVLVATGQEGAADANVYIFIQQDDKFAMMTTTVYSSVFENCRDFGYASSNPNLAKYQNCMQDLMKNNLEVEKVAKQKMQELLTSFDIE